MRTISEQELKDILDKHGKWLRNENGGVRADLSYADLRSAYFNHADLRSANFNYANLSYADLRFADLQSADLRFADLQSANLSCADLRYANLSSANLNSANLRCANLRYANLNSADLRCADLIIFQFQQHQAFYTLDGTLRIGCLVMPITEWALGFEEIGFENQYTKEQIDMYGNFIKMCLEKFKKEN